jgi:hypothetical protein
MSWNTGHFSLNPGQTLDISYWWGDDHGPQMALGREFTGSTLNNLLTAENQSINRNSNNSLTYMVPIFNQGSNVATFELIGGSLS